MKRWLSLFCILCCLTVPGRAESAVWTEAAWNALMEEMAYGEVAPVPAELRVSVSWKDISLHDPEEEKGYMNFLVFSSDSPDIDRIDGRTDAILVCRVNLETGETRLLSLPEDALTVVPGLPYPVSLRYVNCFGGPSLLVKTVNEALLLSVSQYLTVNMETFVNVIDALGGVTMELKEGEAMALGLSAGRNTLDGERALAYVRLRTVGDGSPRLRALIEGVMRQVQEIGSLSVALNTLDMILPAISTNMTTGDLVNLAFALLDQTAPEGVVSRALIAESGYTLGDDAIRQCRGFLYGDGRASSAGKE